MFNRTTVARDYQHLSSLARSNVKSPSQRAGARLLIQVADLGDAEGEKENTGHSHAVLRAVYSVQQKRRSGRVASSALGSVARLGVDHAK